jgi:hypothetical protein
MRRRFWTPSHEGQLKAERGGFQRSKRAVGSARDGRRWRFSPWLAMQSGSLAWSEDLGKGCIYAVR